MSTNKPSQVATALAHHAGVLERPDSPVESPVPPVPEMENALHEKMLQTAMVSLGSFFWFGREGEDGGKWFWEETCGNKQTRYTCLPVYLLVSVEGLYDIEMLQTRNLTWIPNMMLWKMHLNFKNWRNFEYFGYLLVWFQAVIGLPNHFLEGLVHPITLSTFAAKQCTQQCIGEMVLPL